MGTYGSITEEQPNLSSWSTTSGMLPEGKELIMIVSWFRRKLMTREGKRLPFMVPPLRQAGQGAWEKFDEAFLSVAFGWGAILAMGGACALIWASQSLGKPWPFVSYLGLVNLLTWVLVVLIVWLATRRARRQLADYHLGWLAERGVGEALEECRKDLPYVFHDIVEVKQTGHFNIDHVAIGEAGVFIFETKGRRKPEEGDVTISYDGKHLRFADGRNGWS